MKNKNNSFKSKLRVTYDCALGMYVIEGNSLTRTDCNNKTFYDKKVAESFKETIDNQDFHFFNELKLNKI